MTLNTLQRKASRITRARGHRMRWLDLTPTKRRGTCRLNAMRHTIFDTVIVPSIGLTIGETLHAIGVSLVLAPIGYVLLFLFLAL